MSDLFKGQGLSLFVSMCTLGGAVITVAAFKLATGSIRQEMRDTEQSLSINSKDAHKLLDSKIEALKEKVESVESKIPDRWYDGSTFTRAIESNGRRRFLFVERDGESIAAVEIDGRKSVNGWEASALIIRKEFRGLVYIQNEDGSFKVVKP